MRIQLRRSMLSCWCGCCMHVTGNQLQPAMWHMYGNSGALCWMYKHAQNCMQAGFRMCALSQACHTAILFMIPLFHVRRPHPDHPFHAFRHLTCPASHNIHRYTSSQQAELFALKQQLQALKAHAMGSLSPPQGATNPAGPQRPGSSDAAGAQNDARRLLDQGLAGVDGANAVVGGGAGATPAQSVIPSQPSSAVAHIPPPSGQRQQPQQALASTAATPSQQQQALLAQPQMQQGQGGVDTPTRSRNSAMAGPPPAMGITPGPAPPYSNAQSPSRTPLVPNTAQLPQGDGVTFSGLTGGCQGGTTSAAVAPASSDTLSDPLAVMRQLGLVGCDPASDAALLAGPSVPQPHLAEITRLLRRKSELLGTGAYEAGDPLIAAIEARVAQLAGLPVATGA